LRPAPCYGQVQDVALRRHSTPGSTGSSCRWTPPALYLRRPTGVADTAVAEAPVQVTFSPVPDLVVTAVAGPDIAGIDQPLSVT